MYEVVSQDKEKEAESQILSEVRQWDQGLVVPWTEMERHTVLAGLLTLIRLKVGLCVHSQVRVLFDSRYAEGTYGVISLC